MLYLTTHSTHFIYRYMASDMSRASYTSTTTDIVTGYDPSEDTAPVIRYMGSISDRPGIKSAAYISGIFYASNNF